MKGKTIFKGFAAILILLLALSVVISCKPEPKAPKITASQSETAKGVVTAFFEGSDEGAATDIGISCGLTAKANASFAIGEEEYSINLKKAELSMEYMLKDDGNEESFEVALEASADLTGPSAEASGETKTSNVLVDIKSEDLVSVEPSGTITVNGEAIELSAEDAIESIVDKIGIDVSPFGEDDFDFGTVLSESLEANASGTLKNLDFEIKTKIDGKDAELSLSANGDLSAGTSLASGKRKANVKSGMNVELKLRVGDDSISFKASLKEDKSIDDLEAWITGLEGLFDDDEDSKLEVFEEYAGLSITLTEAKVNNAAVDPDSLLNVLIEI